MGCQEVTGSSSRSSTIIIIIGRIVVIIVVVVGVVVVVDSVGIVVILSRFEQTSKESIGGIRFYFDGSQARETGEESYGRNYSDSGGEVVEGNAINRGETGNVWTLKDSPKSMRCTRNTNKG